MLADHDLRLSFLRRPAVSLCAGAAHQHGPFGVAQAGGLQEGLDGLLVVDDGERARPVGAPQAAVETPGVENARERIPDVRERYGSRDSVQAPVTLITAFLRLASSSTLGRSAQGCAAPAARSAAEFRDDR